jgi:hypothetical protein
VVYDVMVYITVIVALNRFREATSERSTGIAAGHHAVRNAARHHTVRNVARHHTVRNAAGPDPHTGLPHIGNGRLRDSCRPVPPQSLA